MSAHILLESDVLLPRHNLFQDCLQVPLDPKHLDKVLIHHFPSKVWVIDVHKRFQISYISPC